MLVEQSAILSQCGQYRYYLRRQIAGAQSSRTLAFIMLNPSTADATKNDPTIGRCMSFAATWGYSEMIVGNLYALRSSDPSVLKTSLDPVGPENANWLDHIACKAETIVCAWGGNAAAERAQAFYTQMTDAGRALYCLGMNKDRSPKHPLYIKGTKQLEEWTFASR